ncbi:hypothetical protein PMM47T1_24119 [Pseudomonas sp. M47T1]|uniref:hypothetical protein n=1 Tax=Pseudomonas sp. M47T1 TaxID=1179778 RepID=UPI0002607DFF|nr:hypothetical protein [Pseudomonas sp. M47T1]EIK94036.1 hypothetical protein PMM47T1_24119 [Pseudomonas sp. M47T1]
MTASNQSLADLAVEAEFQLTVAKDQLVWLAALAGAIQLSHVHEGGRHAVALAEIAKHFSDTGFSGVASAVDQFKAIAEASYAPQNDGDQIVARGEGN